MPIEPLFPPLDISRIRTFPIKELSRKVRESEFARTFSPEVSFQNFVESLPDILAAHNLKILSQKIAYAVRMKRAVILMFGGHMIKVGLSPLIVDWMRKGILTALATNGSGIIHDVEIALFGRTSEDVTEGLAEGKFGMSEETGRFINEAVQNPEYQRLGMGEALSLTICQSEAPFKEKSLLWASREFKVPLTVHVALGTDIVHQHPITDGAAIGRASYTDFLVFSAQVTGLTQGAVVMNFGSAVVMPEVFLKALTITRNLGYPTHGFTAANFDMFTHYRPTQNVLIRPTLTGGEYYNFIGHHEIMFPLLYGMVNQAMSLDG